MLCGHFKENSEDTVALEEVDPKEFLQFLKATAPKPEAVRSDTVLFLIRLADRFDVAELMQRCEEHLLSAKD
ncbi:hypothetical protein AAVH_27940, partial [Aphelenchoides avenae]